MKGDKNKGGTWSRREIFRVGSLATAAGAMGGIAVTDGAASPQAPASQLPASPGGAQLYTRIGVRPFINLTGTLTINGGALTLPEVREASHQAADHAVDIDELMEKVGARIAELIGCEAAIVTSGAAAALSQATAACLAGTDPELMQQLPDLTGLKDEVIMPSESRNVYDHAFRSWGTRVIEVDSVEALHAALGPRTAIVAVLGTGEARGALRLDAIVAAARKAGVPVIVDAAAELPRRPDPYLTRGADLVAYSGGKSMRGPQCAGLLLGRKDLVWAAFMNGAPHHAVARMMKVGKEEIMGMLAAVEVLMSRGMDEDVRKWKSWLGEISNIVSQVPGVRTTMHDPAGASPYPTMNVEWDPQQIGITAGRESCRTRPATATRSAFVRRRFGPEIRCWPGAASPRCCNRHRRARRRSHSRRRPLISRDAGRSTCSTAWEPLATSCSSSRAETAWKAVISADDCKAP
jgi:D-glucosaminate-6-phosphate ammonia-lyase